jgi:hypothetical protein
MNKVGVAMVSGVSGKLAEPALIQFKQSLKQTQGWILASIGLLVTGDTWNITLHVHTRPYAIGYHVVNGHKIFCYVESSKWWSDFIGTKGYSIGDLLIYIGVTLLTIIAIILIWNILKVNGKRKGEYTNVKEIQS